MTEKLDLDALGLIVNSVPGVYMALALHKAITRIRALESRASQAGGGNMQESH